MGDNAKENLDWEYTNVIYSFRDSGFFLGRVLGRHGLWGLILGLGRIHDTICLSKDKK